MKTSEIQHFPDQNLFRMQVENDFATINYSVHIGVYYLNHSEVPMRLRGKGIGKELVEKTFDYLHQNNIQAVAVCSYIKAIAKRSEKFKTIIG